MVANLRDLYTVTEKWKKLNPGLTRQHTVLYTVLVGMKKP